MACLAVVPTPTCWDPASVMWALTTGYSPPLGGGRTGSRCHQWSLADPPPTIRAAKTNVGAATKHKSARLRVRGLSPDKIAILQFVMAAHPCLVVISAR